MNKPVKTQYLHGELSLQDVHNRLIQLDFLVDNTENSLLRLDYIQERIDLRAITKDKFNGMYRYGV